MIIPYSQLETTNRERFRILKNAIYDKPAYFFCLFLTK